MNTLLPVQLTSTAAVHAPVHTDSCSTTNANKVYATMLQDVIKENSLSDTAEILATGLLFV